MAGVALPMASSGTISAGIFFLEERDKHYATETCALLDRVWSSYRRL